MVTGNVLLIVVWLIATGAVLCFKPNRSSRREWLGVMLVLGIFVALYIIVPSSHSRPPQDGF